MADGALLCWIEHPQGARGRYTDGVTKNNAIDAGLARIKRLEEQLARAPRNSGRRRQFARAIRIEADLYRKSLDTAQASEQFDAKPARPFTGRASRLGIPAKFRGLH